MNAIKFMHKNEQNISTLPFEPTLYYSGINCYDTGYPKLPQSECSLAIEPKVKPETMEEIEKAENATQKPNSRSLLTRLMSKQANILTKSTSTKKDLKTPWKNIDNPCVICDVELSSNNYGVLHPCKHVFCQICIVKLSDNKFVCPLCRSTIRWTGQFSQHVSRHALGFITFIALMGILALSCTFIFLILLPL